MPGRAVSISSDPTIDRLDVSTFTVPTDGPESDGTALCVAFNLPLSSHTAPMQHVHAACAAIPFTEIEYFHDHVRIERMFFDGLPGLRDGKLHPDLSRPGNGPELKLADARKFAA